MQSALAANMVVPRRPKRLTELHCAVLRPSEWWRQWQTSRPTLPPFVQPIGCPRLIRSPDWVRSPLRRSGSGDFAAALPKATRTALRKALKRMTHELCKEAMRVVCSPRAGFGLHLGVRGAHSFAFSKRGSRCCAAQFVDLHRCMQVCQSWRDGALLRAAALPVGLTPECNRSCHAQPVRPRLHPPSRRATRVPVSVGLAVSLQLALRSIVMTLMQVLGARCWRARAAGACAAVGAGVVPGVHWGGFARPRVSVPGWCGRCG